MARQTLLFLRINGLLNRYPSRIAMLGVSAGRLPSRASATWLYGLSAVLLVSILLSLHSYKTPLRISTPLSHSSRLLDDVRNRTLGFHKILVVGLPERTDRRDGIILAAGLSGMDVEFVDSVRGDTVVDKALPGVLPADLKDDMKPAEIGCWRGHVNALQRIVQQNLGSALIMEDDVDWDIRVKDQLRDFALASNALIQPLSGESSKYADPTYPHPSDKMYVPANMDYKNLPSTKSPKFSPYGDEWEMLWLGHCGMRVPSPERESPETLSKGVIVRLDDETTVKRENLSNIQHDDLGQLYPSHTRLYHHGTNGLCALAYAVSQEGARQMLYQIGLEEIKRYDIGLLHFCDHATACLTTQPPLFEHFRPKGWAGAESDISGHGDQMNEAAKSMQMRWSVRLNEKVLMRGGGKAEYVDQWPD